MPALVANQRRPIAWSTLAGPGAFALGLLVLSLVVAVATVSGVDAAAVGVMLGIPSLAIAGAIVAVRGSYLHERLARRLFDEPGDAESTIQALVDCAERAHQQGIGALVEARAGGGDPLLAIGVHLVVAGAEPNLIRVVLERRLDELTRREAFRQRALAALARTTPIAAVPALAVVAGTLWSMRDGLWTWWSPLIAAGAAMLALPALAFAGPIGVFNARRVGVRAMTGTLVIEGVLAIRAGVHPGAIAARLRSILPPSRRPTVAVSAAAA